VARQARSKSTTGIYHVMLRGNERKSIFLDEEDKLKFIDILLQKKEGEASLLYAYCVMDNHVHMVIHEAGQLLDRFMKRIGITYAAYFNRKYNRVGHVFQDRFRSEPIDDEAYLLSVIRYIHKNPFGPEQSLSPDYLWSSYPSYMGYNDSMPLLPEMEDILVRFSSDRKSAQQGFNEFHLAEEAQHLFLDMPDETENAEDILKSFLESQAWSMGDLKKNENQLIVKELIELLIVRSKISGRQIAQLTEINREKVRKMVVSLELLT
jgi:REP element-mobilizing transposase RayT